MADEGEFPKADAEKLYGKDANMNYYQGAFGSTLNHESEDVSTTAVEVVAANASRKSILIQNNGTVTCYLGIDNSVTDATGFPLEVSESVMFYNQDAIWGITTALTADIRYMEVE